MAQVFCALAAAGLGGAVLVAAVCLGVAGGGGVSRVGRDAGRRH